MPPVVCSRPTTRRMRRWPPRYLETTDMSGNDCGLDGHAEMPFTSEAQRRAMQSGEEQR